MVLVIMMNYTWLLCSSLYVNLRELTLYIHKKIQLAKNNIKNGKKIKASSEKWFAVICLWTDCLL